MLTHFQALLLFALLVSVVFACLTRRSISGRAQSALLAFLLFIVVGVAIGWLMYPFSR